MFQLAFVLHAKSGSAAQTIGRGILTRYYSSPTLYYSVVLPETSSPASKTLSGRALQLTYLLHESSSSTLQLEDDWLSKNGILLRTKFLVKFLE